MFLWQQKGQQSTRKLSSGFLFFEECTSSFACTECDKENNILYFIFYILHFIFFLWGFLCKPHRNPTAVIGPFLQRQMLLYLFYFVLLLIIAIFWYNIFLLTLCYVDVYSIYSYAMCMYTLFIPMLCLCILYLYLCYVYVYSILYLCCVYVLCIIK